MIPFIKEKNYNLRNVDIFEVLILFPELNIFIFFSIVFLKKKKQYIIDIVFNFSKFKKINE